MSGKLFGGTIDGGQGRGQGRRPYFRRLWKTCGSLYGAEDSHQLEADIRAELAAVLGFVPMPDEDWARAQVARVGFLSPHAPELHKRDPIPREPPTEPEVPMWPKKEYDEDERQRRIYKAIGKAILKRYAPRGARLRWYDDRWKMLPPWGHEWE